MTQPKLLELAKQGEPQAIAILMNRSLQPQGMSVKVTREGDRLSVLLQADQTPNRLVMTNFVRNGITNLKLQSVIQSVDIIGQRTGDPQPAWVQELQLSALDTPGAFLDALDPSSDMATAAEGDNVLDLPPSDGPAASEADELSSLLDGNEAELAIERDLFSDETSTTDDLGLAFEDEGLGLGDPSFNGLDLGTSASASDLDFSSSSDLGDLDLGQDDPDFSSFEDDPMEFSTLDLGMDLPPSSEPEDFSLTSDLSSDFSSDLTSNDLTFDSLDEPTAPTQDWSLETTSFDSLDESFGESSNSLDFGETNDLDFGDLGQSPTDDLDLSGFSTSDEFGLANDFSTDALTTDDLGLNALGEAPASTPDWSLDESFDESSSSLDFGETNDLDLSGLGESPTDALGFSGEFGAPDDFGTDELAADDLGLDAFSETPSSELDWSLESPNSLEASLDEPSATLDFGETNELDLSSFSESPRDDLGLSGELGIHELAPDDLGLDAFSETPSSELDWSLESPGVPTESFDDASNSLDFDDMSALDLGGLGEDSADDLGFSGEFGAPEDFSANELTVDDLGLDALGGSPALEPEADWSLEPNDFTSLDESLGDDTTASLDLTNDLDLDGLDALELNDSEAPAYEPPSDIIMDRQAFNAGGMPLSADLGLGGFDSAPEPSEDSFYEPPSEIILDNTDDFSLMSNESLSADEPSSISDEVAALFDESNTGFEAFADSDLSGFEDSQSLSAFDSVNDFGEINAFDESSTDLETFSMEPPETETFGVTADPSLAAEVANLFEDDTLDFDTTTFDDAGFDSTLTPEGELGVTADITPGDEEPLFGSANFGQGVFEESPRVELETREENPIPEDFGLSFDAPSPSEDWTFDDAGIAAETDIPLGDPDLPFGETVPLGELDLSFGEDESDTAPLFDVEPTTSDLDMAFAADLTDASADADLVGEDSALESDLDLNLDLQTLDLESGFEASPSSTEDWATDAAIADLGTPDLLERNGMVADDPYDAGLFGGELPPELDLSGLELDDSALNDFADSSSDDEVEGDRFSLTSGDLGSVDSASGVVLDLSTALPESADQDILAFDTGLGSDLPPVDLDAQPAPVDAPDAIAAADALVNEIATPPVADFTLVSSDQDVPENVSSQSTLIDESDLLFDIDENALDNSTFTTGDDLDDEIILTPNVHDDAEDWAASPNMATPDPSLSLAATPGIVESYDPDGATTPGEPSVLPPDAYGEDRAAAVVPPAPPDGPHDPQPSSSRKRGLFALISLLVGLWLLGILAISLLRRQPDPTPGVATQPTTAPDDPASPNTVPTPAPAPATENPFQDGLSRGASAANLAQTAQSADDWGLVASQWQQAIARFQAVPQSSPDYATAQQKITEYQGYLAVAQQRIASVPAVTETPPTAPALIVSDVNCQAIETSETSPRLELSNVQLNGTAGSPIQLVGCLTNHTDQPISAVSVVYEQSNTEAPDAVQRTLGRLEVATIRPGETQPFRSDFVLGTDMNQATIQALQWSVPNERTPQEEEVEVSAALE